MAQGKANTKKTKTQLLQEVTKLRKRVAELEGQTANSESDASSNGSPDTPASSFEMEPLNRIAESVEQALRTVVPAGVDIRLCTEERLGLIHADPGVAEQLVVHLFLTRSNLQSQP